MKSYCYTLEKKKKKKILSICLLAGKKFGIDASNKIVTNEEGAEIDCIEVIRDNDRLFIVDEQDYQISS